MSADGFVSLTGGTLVSPIFSRTGLETFKPTPHARGHQADGGFTDCFFVVDDG